MASLRILVCSSLILTCGIATIAQTQDKPNSRILKRASPSSSEDTVTDTTAPPPSSPSSPLPSPSSAIVVGQDPLCPIPFCESNQVLVRLESAPSVEELSVNECGPYLESVDINLDFIVPDFEFEECCNFHDRCYATCGANKTQCERLFYRCMQRICDAEDTDFLGLERRACREAAMCYAAILRESELACDQFRSSQRRYCQCQDATADNINVTYPSFNVSTVDDDDDDDDDDDRDDNDNFLGDVFDDDDPEDRTWPSFETVECLRDRDRIIPAIP